MPSMLDRNVAMYTRMLSAPTTTVVATFAVASGLAVLMLNTHLSVDHAMRVPSVRLLSLTSRGTVQQGMRSLLSCQAEGADLREPISIATMDLPSWEGEWHKMPSLVVMRVLYVDRQRATVPSPSNKTGAQRPIDSNILGPAAVEVVWFQMGQVEQMRRSIRSPMKGESARQCHRLCVRPMPLF